MNYEDTVKTWRWRIAKAGVTMTAFAKEIDLHPSQLSFYINLRRIPNAKLFLKIESKLLEMGV